MIEWPHFRSGLTTIDELATITNYSFKAPDKITSNLKMIRDNILRLVPFLGLKHKPSDPAVIMQNHVSTLIKDRDLARNDGLNVMAKAHSFISQLEIKVSSNFKAPNHSEHANSIVALKNILGELTTKIRNRHEQDYEIKDSMINDANKKINQIKHNYHNYMKQEFSNSFPDYRDQQHRIREAEYERSAITLENGAKDLESQAKHIKFRLVQDASHAPLSPLAHLEEHANNFYTHMKNLKDLRNIVTEEDKIEINQSLSRFSRLAPKIKEACEQKTSEDKLRQQAYQKAKDITSEYAYYIKNITTNQLSISSRIRIICDNVRTGSRSNPTTMAQQIKDLVAEKTTIVKAAEGMTVIGLKPSFSELEKSNLKSWCCAKITLIDEAIQKLEEKKHSYGREEMAQNKANLNGNDKPQKTEMHKIAQRN